MPSIADIQRKWLLKTLGINSSALSESDLVSLLGGDKTAPIQSEAISPYQSGYWYSSAGSVLNTVLCTPSQLRGVPFIAGRDLTVDALGVEVTAAGTAGSVVRLGIYKDKDDGTIELVVDAGTVAGDVVARPTKTFAALDLIAGQLYWLVAVAQGAPVTEPTLRTLGGSGISIGAPDASTGLQNILAGLQIAGVAGALPATLNKSFTTNPIRPVVRAV